jgi:hypothetical protein
MAISNLLPASGANDNRPNLKQFFGKNPATANDNVERVSSGMFSNAFVDSVVTTLHSLIEEIAKINDIAKSVIASFGAIVKSIKNLNKDVTNRFRVLNNELNASKIDFIRTVLAIPKTEAPVKIDGVPVNVNAPEAVKKEESKGFDLEELLAAFLGGGIAKGAIQATLRGLMSFGTTLLKPLVTFFAGPLGAGLLAGSLVAYGIYEIMGGMIRDYNKKLGIVPGMSDPEIERRKREHQGERKEAPYRDMAELRLLASQVMDGKHDEELGIKPTDNAKASDKIRQKVAEDLLLPVPVIDPRLTNRPVIKTRAEREQEKILAQGEPGFTGTQGQVMQDVAKAAGVGGDTGAPTPAAPPANPTKGMTAVEKSRYNRDQAAKELAGRSGAPAGEVKTESNTPAPPPSGAPAGTPAATSMAPPPAGPSGGGEGVGAGGGVAVVQNSSVKNVGTTAGAETGGMTGQNIPMFSRNPKLQDAFQRQLMREHQ